MKYSILTCSISHRAGGLFQAIKDLYMQNIFLKEDITIFSFIDKETYKDIKEWKHIKIYLAKDYFFSFYSIKLKKSILSSNADILHIHGLWRFPHLFINTWDKKRKSPILCTPHGMLDPYIIAKQGKLKRYISSLFFDSALNKITCFHALCKKEALDIRAYGLTQPIAIIPNGVELPTSIIHTTIDKKKQLLYLGRIHPKKGIDLLLYAIKNIAENNIHFFEDWHIDIVGWDHENTLCKLKKIIEKNNLCNYITFHGELYGDKKNEIFSSANAFILPSHGEGLPMSILEAWSWKLPVLMTEQCNLPEGFKYEAAIKIEDNTQSVINGLYQLFHMSESQLNTMGENGYKLVKTHFSWECSAQKMVELYNWLTKKGKKPEFIYLYDTPIDTNI